MSYAANVGVDLIDIMAGGVPDSSTQQWLRDRSHSIQNQLSQTGQQFFEKARNMYQVIDESRALQVLRNLMHKRNEAWVSNNIRAIETLEGLQTADPYMQRWIMAEPELRYRYLNQTVDGYSDSYVNHHGDAIKDDHYDYRRVMDGVVIVDDEDESIDFKVKHYYEFEDDPIRLTIYEKKAILDVWALVRHYLDEGGEDPTSVTGAQL